MLLNTVNRPDKVATVSVCHRSSLAIYCRLPRRRNHVHSFDKGDLALPRDFSNRSPDAVIEWVFSRIKARSRFYVEILGAQTTLSRFAATSASRGWQGVVASTTQSGTFFDLHDPCAHVLKALTDSNTPTHFDLLSINDLSFSFHLLRVVLEQYTPRVVVTTYNRTLTVTEDIVAPYIRGSRQDPCETLGASLEATRRLAEHFGYIVLTDHEREDGVVVAVRYDHLSRAHNNERALFNTVAHHSPEAHRSYLSSAHYLLSGIKTVNTSYGWISYFRNDEFIGEQLGSGFYWQDRLIQEAASSIENPNGLALDIGAHVGTHAIALARLSPGLSFVCFEPQIPLFILLERNICENRLGGRIRAICSAVAHGTMQARLCRCTTDGSAPGREIEYGSDVAVNLGGIQLGSDGQPCSVISIDDQLFKNVCYVKIDVEGAERLVLSGMKRTIKANLPVIVLEDRADRRLPQGVNQLLGVKEPMRSPIPFLQSYGYKARRLVDDWLAVAQRETTGEGDLIPKGIFQTWKSKYNIPSNFKTWSVSFKQCNPAYYHRIWDDTDNREFMSSEYPWFLAQYDAYPAEICRADVVRYFYLYSFGGIYADMDTECLRPLDGLLSLGDVLLGRIGTDPTFQQSIPNAIMASRPRQEFWLLLMALLVISSGQRGRPEYLTGPIILKKAVDLYRNSNRVPALHYIGAVRRMLRTDQHPEDTMSNIVVLDGSVWYPLDWTNSEHQQLRLDILDGKAFEKHRKAALFGKAFMATYWAHSWE